MGIYSAARASEYDEKSAFDKGDRERHREYLGDLLGALNISVREFLELGCGTGFYTELISSRFPTAHGVAIDGSDSMLAVASTRLRNCGPRLELECARLEALDFTRWSGRIDLVFCGVTLSSLEDAGKQKVIRGIYEALRPGGVFILFDQFRPQAMQHARINEYLACCDMQRRLGRYLELPLEAPALNLSALIEADRRSKIEDGDHETSVESYLEMLASAGFSNRFLVFQEPRLCGLHASKGGE